MKIKEKKFLPTPFFFFSLKKKGLKFSVFLVSLLVFASCTKKSPELGTTKTSPELGTTKISPELGGLEADIETNKTKVLSPEIIKNRCIRHNFIQGSDDHLYGRDCIEAKELTVRSSDKGTAQAIMKTSGGADSVVIEPGVHFMNQIYDLDYSILESNDTSTIPFLLDFIKEGEKFLALPGREYKIVFKVEGNYLVLYKGSQNKNDIPYNERTAMIEDKEKGLYMVPFIGYPIQYCEAEFVRNNQNELTRQVRPKCSSEATEKSDYLNISKEGKKLFDYRDKRNVFPADYFDIGEGEWFYSEIPIESEEVGELLSAESKLIKIASTSNSLYFIDNSGNLSQQRQKNIIYEIPIQWLDFELDKKHGLFSQFAERVNSDESEINRPYIKLLFTEHQKNIEKVVISPQYFSFVYLKGFVKEEKGVKSIKYIKYKVSLLKKDYVPSEKFQQRKWFVDDALKVFFATRTKPQQEVQSLLDNSSDTSSSYRIIKFDTSLYTKEEKKAQTKILKWYFSKNSTDKEQYRSLVREAVAIYNRAFKIIADGAAPKIQIQLVEDEEKDLGDMRYNIINMIKEENRQYNNNILFGLAYGHFNPDTGQNISSVLNIIINSLENKFTTLIREYIRYEIFQSPKLNEEDNKINVVSEYLQWKIKKECPDVVSFINNKRGVIQDYRTELKDSELILSCATKVARPLILWNIVHEMGHGFSEHHNYACSMDEKNFYKDIDEIRDYFPTADVSEMEELKLAGLDFIPKTSCVMDYPNGQEQVLTVPGKNDLMVLRYIYEDELELEGHEKDQSVVHEMNFNYENIDMQYSLESRKDLMDKKKDYLNCVPTQKEKLYCVQWDHGSNYKEVAENQFKVLKRGFKMRFSYDLSPTVKGQYPFGFLDIFSSLEFIHNYYKRWVSLRDGFFNSQAHSELLDYYHKDEGKMKNYEKLVNQLIGTRDDVKETEFALLSPATDIYRDMLKFFWSQRPLHCQVESEKGERHDLNFNYIVYAYLVAELGQNNVYVIDCYSQQVVDFLDKKGFKLVGQFGLQSLEGQSAPRSFSLDPSNERTDVLSLNGIQKILYPNQLPQFNPENMSFTTPFFSDPIFIKDMYHLLQENLLDENTFFNELETRKNLYFIRMFKRSLLRDSRSQEARDLIIENQSYLSRTETAFFNSIEESLKEGRDITSFQNPFLEKLWNDYQKTEKSMSFMEYVKQDEAVITVENQGYGDSKIYIPYKTCDDVEDKTTCSFIYKKHFKYNEALKEYKELEAKGSQLSFLEKMRKDTLKGYIDNFSKLF